MSIPTPHIEAKLGDYAKTVLMPGDPLRAKFIAENYLKNIKMVNNVRGMAGFTGEYKGKRVSVQGSGMGIPSMGIYSYELYNFYEVESIIRIGSAGAIDNDLNVGDIVIGVGASTNSNYISAFNLSGMFAPTASYRLIEGAVNVAKRVTKEKDIKYKVGNIISSDNFYNNDIESMKKWQKMGILAVEMEAAGLYINAAYAGKEALCIVTISDTIFTGKTTTAKQRETSFTDMMEIALELI